MTRSFYMSRLMHTVDMLIPGTDDLLDKISQSNAAAFRIRVRDDAVGNLFFVCYFPDYKELFTYDEEG